MTIGGNTLEIRLVELLTIHIDEPIANENRITGQADDTFDVILARVVGILKDHNLPICRLAQRVDDIGWQIWLKQA